MITLDFSKYYEVQDMIKLIEQEKGLSAKDAIEFSVSSKIYKKIHEAGWAGIALSLWGHDDPEREWETMDQPFMEIELEESKLSIINMVAKKYKVNVETAIAYFLIFTMESLGYHI